MDWNCDRLWELLNGDTGRRREGVERARSDPQLGGAMLEALFTDRSDRFLCGAGVKLHDAAVLAHYQQDSASLWAAGQQDSPLGGLGGLYTHVSDAATATWLWFQGGGLLTSAAISSSAPPAQTAQNIKVWMGLDNPAAFEAKRSLGVYQVVGRSVRLISVSSYAAVLYQGFVAPDDGLQLSSISLSNGFRVTKRFQRIL